VIPCHWPCLAGFVPACALAWWFVGSTDGKFMYIVFRIFPGQNLPFYLFCHIPAVGGADCRCVCLNVFWSVCLFICFCLSVCVCVCIQTDMRYSRVCMCVYVNVSVFMCVTQGGKES